MKMGCCIDIESTSCEFSEFCCVDRRYFCVVTKEMLIEDDVLSGSSGAGD